MLSQVLFRVSTDLDMGKPAPANQDRSHTRTAPEQHRTGQWVLNPGYMTRLNRVDLAGLHVASSHASHSSSGVEKFGLITPDCEELAWAESSLERSRLGSVILVR